MTIDSQGVIYTTGPRGIWVVSPSGLILDSIVVPGQNTNCTFGDSSRKTLYVTAGGSLYRVRSGLLTSLDDVDVHKSISGIRSIYPNPIQRSTNIPVFLAASSRVRLEVRSQQGSVVTVLADQFMSAGEHFFTWEPGAVPSGLYLIHMTTDDASSVRTCVVKGE